MPQFIPFTLELQWNSTVLIISAFVITLACYVLPHLARVRIARLHGSI